MAKSKFDAILGAANKGSNTKVAFRMSEAPKATLSQVLSTGNYAIDYGVLKIGGLPLGRIVEIFGLESSGKSTLAKYVVREAQKTWPDVPPVYFDAEFADSGQTGLEWAQKCGVDVDNVVYAPLNWAEDILVRAEQVLVAGAKLVVIDSVGAMVAKSTADRAPGGGFRTQKASIMAEMVPKINALAFEHDALVIFINQQVDLPGVTMGDAFTTPGGRKLKYHASIRLQVSRKYHINENGIRVGAMCRVKTYKNKTAQPGLAGDIPIYFDGRKFTQFDWIFENAVKLNIVIRVNNITWEYPDANGATMQFKGKNAIRDYFLNDAEAAELLQQRVLERGSLIATEAIEGDEEDVDAMEDTTDLSDAPDPDFQGLD